MGKQEYLDALRKAMTGLPDDIVAKTLAYYEQRFVDGAVAGHTEEETSKDLDEPRKIAMTLRANTQRAQFEQTKTPANFLRVAVSATGLAVFNLFMVVPAAVFASLLAAMYACAFAFYVGGIAITASGMAGANELVLDGPLKHIVIDGEEVSGGSSQTRVSISQRGIQVYDEPKFNHDGEDVDVDTDGDNEHSSRVIERAERMAGHGIHISTDLDAESRATQSFIGISMVVGGIILFLLGLVVTKFSITAVKRYIEMNFSLLRGS